MNARRRRTVFYGISNQMVQYLGQYFEVSAHPRQGVMGNHGAPFRYLVVRREERLTEDRFHVGPGGLPVAGTRGPIVHHVGEQRLHLCRTFPDALEEYAGI